MIYLICQLGHMTRRQDSDWFVKCCCLHSHDAGHVLVLIMLFVHFVTNTCKLFIRNSAQVFKTNCFFCLTLGFIINNLLCLFALLLRETLPQLKTNIVTVVICSKV